MNDKKPSNQHMSRKETVLLITYDYPPCPGGIANFSTGIKQALEEFCGDTVVLTCIPPGNETCTPQPDVFRIHPRSKTGYFKFLLKGIRVAKRYGISRTLALAWSPCGWTALCIRMFLGIPYWTISFGNELVHAQSGQENPVAYMLRKIIRVLVFRYAAKNLAISSFTKSLIAKFHADQEKIGIIHPGVDTSVFRPCHPDYTIPGLSDLKNRRIILTVARLVPDKGIDRVMIALANLKEEFRDIFYVIIGDGPDRERLTGEMSRLGIESWCGIFRDVESHHLVHYYNACEMFVLMSYPDYPRRSVEGFGMVLIEASACGKPVIASRTGGIPDAVEDGVTGLLVDPDSPDEVYGAIRKCLLDSDLGASLGKSGYNRCNREFTWSHTGRALASVLNEKQTG